MSESTPAVFLSYAREDTDAARRIADALRSHGVEVWFDQSELRGGDAWDAKIRKQINDCTLFLPIISAHTQSRGKGYFRLEWKLAVEQTHLMAEGMAFLAPVVIDETPEGGALVPPEFMRVQWTRLPGALPTPAFVAQVKRLLENPGKAAPTTKPFAGGSSAPLAPPPSKLRFPLWALGILALLAAGLVFLFVMKPKAEPPPVPSPVANNPSPAPPAAPAASDKSIAVLPFTNMSEDKDNAFFADGMQEDILTNLALIRDFRVVSRTTVMSYRTTTKSIRQIAAELGVAYILEGSVQRAGNKVRVTGQLIKAATDEHVWAQAYDRDLTDVFGIQAELSQSIATAMKTVLSPEEKAMITQKPTDNPAAYDLYLQARAVANLDNATVAGRARRARLLEQAVALDPKFAQAWGDLADSYAYSNFCDDEGKEALMTKAKAAMERALQLAPDSPDVVGSYGTYFYYGYRDYVRAAEQYERLARLQPNAPRIFNSLGLIQRRQGHWAESLANTRKALELDPANLNYLRNLLSTAVAGRRWDEAILAERRIVALVPDNINEAFQLGILAFQATGSTREGDAFIAGLSPERKNSPRGISLRQGWAAETGNFAEFARLDKLQPFFDEDGTPHSQQALGAAAVYMAMGEVAAARARLGDEPAQLRARIKSEPGNLNNLFVLAGMEAILGHADEARRLADQGVGLMPLSRDALDGALFAQFRAVTYDWSGDKDYALAEYQRLFRVPTSVGGNVHEMKISYSTLHGDARYEAMLADPKNNEPLF
jgi:TolB-like protein/cytochrome c-type biogenesis protein CcmH/NrfG